MAASLSDGEFNRMQSQLLGLRETNYELEDKCRKQEKELTLLRDQLSLVEKDFQKANQALSKSKKAKDVELLIHENESMQMKLQSQEDDFRVQNQALMNELGKLVSVNETLEKELNDAKSTQQTKCADESTNDIRRLQAQNTALQNSLLTCQREHEEQCSVLRQTIAELKEQSLKPASVPENVEPTSEKEDVDNGPEKLNDTSNGQINNNHSATDEDAAEVSICSSAADDSMRQIHEFRLNLDTEKEENRLLKEQLQTMEANYKEEIKTLQNEVEKLNEKLKKKQESLLQLQADKDRLFCELSEKVQDVQTNKDNEIRGLRQQSSKLQQELALEKQHHEEELKQSKARVLEMEIQLTALQRKVDSVSQETNNRLAEQLAHYENQVTELQNQVLERNNKIDDLQTQLKECQKSQSSTMDQLLAVQLDRDNQILAAQEANRLAEKRKALLDQLAVKYQEDTDHHRDQVKSLTSSHETKVSELTAEIEQLHRTVAEQSDVKNQLEQLKPQIAGLEGAKTWLERRLKEAEETLEATRNQHEVQIESIKHEHESMISRISDNNASHVKELEATIVQLQKEREELDEDIGKLKQEIKDQIDGKVLHEKKGSTMLKDLKRQLHAERKRADKLQEKLQEFLSDSRSRQSVEELFRPIDERQKFGDNSSLSSWSPSGLGRDNSITALSPDEDVSYASLRQENDDLVKRLADVQEQKWILEEKVSHLESSNAAMVDDLLRKTAVIEHYSMDSKAGQGIVSPSNERMTPLKRVVDFVIDKGDDGMKDINRKLQRVLEETLTKNMHLQQDLEVMSKEVEELRNRPSKQPA